MHTNYLTQPGPLLLTAFGSAAACILFCLVYFISFSWMFVNELLALLAGLPVLIFLLLTLWADKKFKTQLKRYSILTVVLLVACLAGFAPLKKQILRDTEKRGNALMAAIKNYRQAYGHYPKNLEGSYFYTIPKKALIARPFNYRAYATAANDTVAEISCASFDGNYAGLSSNRNIWFYWD